MKVAPTVACVLLCLMARIGFSSGLPGSAADDSIQEIPVNVELIYKVGSSKENEDFFGPRWFCVDSDENVYVLDAKNSRVQCFSKDGRFYLSFGRFGQGPGELTKAPKKIRLLQDGNIYVIDTHLKINVYDRKGTFLKMIKIDNEYRDIELIDGHYYLCSHFMTKDSKPIHVFDQSGKEIFSFGVIVEPQEGLIRDVAGEPKSYMLEDFFNIQSRLIRTAQNELIHSLATADRLIKYDLKGKVINDYVGDFEFGDKLYTIIHRGIPLPLAESSDVELIYAHRQERWPDYRSFPEKRKRPLVF